ETEGLRDGCAAGDEGAVRLRSAGEQHAARWLQGYDKISGVDAAHVAQREVDSDGFTRIDGAVWTGFSGEGGADVGDDAGIERWHERVNEIGAGGCPPTGAKIVTGH